MKRAPLQHTNSYENKLMRVQSGHLKTSYSRIKTFLYLIIVLVLMTGSLFAQSNKASVSLTAAIYEEEVSGNLDKAVDLYLNILKKYPDDRQVAAKTLYHLGLVNEKMGKQKANEYFKRLVNTYPDQTEMVALAKARLAALGGSVVTGGGAGGLVTRRILTDASGVSGVLTADGKYIRGIDWKTGDVVQFEVASGQRSRITNKGQWNDGEKWYDYQLLSRDGKQIAYTSYTKDGDNQLRIRNLDGSGLRTLYSEKGSYVHPLDWSPDAGSILALLKRDKADELTLISIADGSVRVLRSDIASAWDMLKMARFSPDGGFVAFSSVGESSPPHGDVFLMTADGRNEVVVAGHPAEDQLLGWTPDGRSLVFLSDRSGTWDMWAVRITGGKQAGEPELLKKDFGYDAEVLGFASDGSCYYKTVTYLGRLYNGEINLETGKVLVPPAPVTTRYTGGQQNFLRWSPDGRSLAYVTRPGNNFGPGNNILTIRSAATGEERFLSPRLRAVNMPSWAPDGRSVIALGFTETGPKVFRIDAETSGITKLAGKGLFPKLCPDGKTLVFLGEGGIRKRNLDTGEESEVVKAGAMQYYDLSPDGREVVFQLDGAVKIVSLIGGEPRELFRGLAKSYDLRWTRDGRYIIVQAWGTASSEIWRVPAQGGTPLKLELSVPKLLFFALHPDNRRFAFSVNEGTKEELWVMENFLPKKVPEEKEFSIKKISEALTDGAISPDGRYISYMGETGNLEIYETATGKKSCLTTNNGLWDEYALSSRWSPDGTQLVYDWSNKNSDVDFYIVGVNGSKPRILYSNDKENAWAETFDWSPDGKHILSCLKKSDGQYQMVLVSTTDGSVQILKILEHGWPSNMNFSPDGRYIVYDFKLKEDTQERDISILPIDGSREIPLIEHPVDDYVLGWAPDGKNILFASDRRKSTDAWVIQFSEGKVQGIPILVKANIGKVYPMGFARKGSFYYDINDFTRAIYFAELDPESGKMLAPPKKLSTRFEGSLTQPEYSPDGKFIAYISNESDISIQSLETGKMQEFPFRLLRNINSPRWSPDGRSILVGGWGRANGVSGVYRIDTRSGIFTLLFPSAGHFSWTHEWSSDGKAIFLGRYSDKQTLSQIMLRDIESGTEKELYRESADKIMDCRLSCSPDGKWLAFFIRGKDQVLRIMPAAGGEPRELYRFKGKDNLVGIRWTTDGKYILFEQKQTEEKKYSWWRIPMEGGEPQKLGLEWNTLIYTSFHHDGRHIVFSSYDSKGENSGNYVMENFLPK